MASRDHHRLRGFTTKPTRAQRMSVNLSKLKAAGTVVIMSESEVPEAFTRVVNIQGGRARIRVGGPNAAPPVLLLHGLGRSLEDWSPQHILLSGYRTIALDMPGFGYSTRPTAPISLDVLARAIIAIVDRIGEQRPLCVVGNSLGGAVALQLLINEPDRVASLVLVDSAGFGRRIHPLIRMLGTPVIGRFAANHMNRVSATMIEKACFADPALATQERIERFLAIAELAGTGSAAYEAARFIASPTGQRRGWRSELLAQVVSHHRPTLIVWGGHDRLLPAKQLARAREVLPNAETHIFRDAGHMPQLECPESFAAVVADFLDKSA
jgi:pimeloyl-ACP methyl ester carboxylesterase